jgi:hypothetical protein
MYEKLPSDRIVISTFHDKEGNPRFYEYFDTRTGAVRLSKGPYVNSNDRAKTLNTAATLQEFYELVEWVIETQQMIWRHDRRNNKLIWLIGAFAHLPPKVGDKLAGSSGRVYEVVHVPTTPAGLVWNLGIILDQSPEVGDVLKWVGEARTRNLIDFHADYGAPDTPTVGEATEGDTGTAYPRPFRPTITYLLLRQEPFTISGQPFSGTKELAPRIREYIYDQDVPGRVLQVYGHRMDNLIRFTCCHPRAETTDALAHWFKRCVRKQVGLIKANGISQMLFWSARTAERKLKSGDDVAAGEVSYYLVTEEIEIQEVSSLRNLNITLSAAVGDNIYTISDTGSYATLNWMLPLTGAFDELGDWLWGTLDIPDYGQTGLVP